MMIILMMGLCPIHIVYTHLLQTVLSTKAPEASAPDHIFAYGHLT